MYLVITYYIVDTIISMEEFSREMKVMLSDFTKLIMLYERTVNK